MFSRLKEEKCSQENKCQESSRNSRYWKEKCSQDVTWRIQIETITLLCPNALLSILLEGVGIL